MKFRILSSVSGMKSALTPSASGSGTAITVSASRPHIFIEGRKTVLIVQFPFFGVAQHIVSLRDFLKSLFCLFIAGIRIGMILFRKLPVRTLNLFFIRIFLDSKNVIIISLCHNNCSLHT